MPGSFGAASREEPTSATAEKQVRSRVVGCIPARKPKFARERSAESHRRCERETSWVIAPPRTLPTRCRPRLRASGPKSGFERFGKWHGHPARGRREVPPIHGLPVRQAQGPETVEGEAHATHKPTGETPVPRPGRKPRASSGPTCTALCGGLHGVGGFFDAKARSGVRALPARSFLGPIHFSGATFPGIRSRSSTS